MTNRTAFVTSKRGIPIAPAVPPPTRAERETRAVAALVHKQAFAPGIYGYEREQMALMIARIVLDCEDGK
jgi:hypothetical protein